jgi:hypothetical protein
MSDHAAERFRWRDLCPATGLALASFLTLAAMTLQPPQTGRTIAVMFAPGTDFPEAAAALAEVGARPIRHGAWSGLIVARFAERRRLGNLSIRGAWFLVDPVAAGGCFGVPGWAREAR